MADSSREEKVSAGLKKLKQFQQQRSSKSKSSRKKVKMQSAGSIEEKQEILSVPPIQSEVIPESEAERNSCDLDRTSSNQSPDSSASTEDKLPASNSNLQEARIDLNLQEADNEHNLDEKESHLNTSPTQGFSSTESLRQISLQVNGLVNETSQLMNGELPKADPTSSSQLEDLEKRNQELASLVNSLRQASDTLQFQLEEQRAKSKRSIQQLEQDLELQQQQSLKEQAQLKEQLQVHIQTIGILVAEKTELQSSLQLSQQTAKQKAGEVEELQGRLRACRQRATDLERELQALTSTNQQLEQTNKESTKEIERLKMDNYKTNKTIEELKLANSELSEKLNTKLSELESVEKELTELRNRVSVSENQSSTEQQSNSELEQLYQEKLELEKRLAYNRESISNLMIERDQMSGQYQQYITQLSQQVTSLTDELKQLTCERDALAKERNSLKETLESVQSNSADPTEDPSETKVLLSISQNKNEELSEKLREETEKNSTLLSQLEEQRRLVSEYEKRLSRFEEQQIDAERLAEAMQSDKVAASRAVTQNRQLKSQLEELQTGFVNVTNDRMKLAEELDSQKHITKELGERLSQQEKELRELQDQLSQREDELRTLHDSSQKQTFTSTQIADRMRHYEAQGQLAEMLQAELHQAQEQIKTLTSQNSELRMALATQSIGEDTAREDKDSSKRNDLVASLSASVRQLEMERDQMLQQLEEQKTNRSQLVQQLKKKEVLFCDVETDSNDVVSKKEYAMIKNAMSQLEERFKQTMNRIAELTEERQQLEHLVTQLQSETDTIGDYVALYQIQRGLMHKRASEKDEYIAQLARDREDLKTKLGELQNLVMRLLEERKQFQLPNRELDSVFDVPPFDQVHSCDRESSTETTQSNGNSEVLDSNSVAIESPKPLTTAKKIIDLLNEIESTNLVEKPVLDSFHPCPVCSGRLITV